MNKTEVVVIHYYFLLNLVPHLELKEFAHTKNGHNHELKMGGKENVETTTKNS